MFKSLTWLYLNFIIRSVICISLGRDFQREGVLAKSHRAVFPQTWQAVLRVGYRIFQHVVLRLRWQILIDYSLYVYTPIPILCMNIFVKKTLNYCFMPTVYGSPNTIIFLVDLLQLSQGFLWAGCTSCYPTSGVKALKGTRSTDVNR